MKPNYAKIQFLKQIQCNIAQTENEIEVLKKQLECENILARRLKEKD